MEKERTTAGGEKICKKYTQRTGDSGLEDRVEVNRLNTVRETTHKRSTYQQAGEKRKTLQQ